MFWWSDSGVEKRSEGRTRDISETGAFVFANTCPPEGIQIGFSLFLPAISGFERETRVDADGYVLRVEQTRWRQACDGFAILIEHVLLRANNHIFESGGGSGNDPRFGLAV